jgi:Holliday junction resolvase RusA-like endonuclease
MKIRVYGDPKPQGSKTARVVNGHAIMWESSKKLPEWRQSVHMACKVAAMEHETPILGPVELHVTFHMPRGKSVTRKYPNTMPDTDKLLRAIGDSLQSSGVLSNDGQIVTIVAHKIYAVNPTENGVEIEVLPKL